MSHAAAEAGEGKVATHARDRGCSSGIPRRRLRHSSQVPRLRRLVASHEPVAPVPSAVGEPILAGDLTVTDSQPLPSSKEQCKNGGWRTFGAFKNQGECVGIVRHRARQACIFERVAHGRPTFRGTYGIGADQVHAMRRCISRRISG